MEIQIPLDSAKCQISLANSSWIKQSIEPIFFTTLIAVVELDMIKMCWF